MGKLICFNFGKKNKKLLFVWFFFFFSREEIVKWKKLDGGGNCGFREAIVDILLVQSGFQYYFLFCLNNKLVLI